MSTVLDIEDIKKLAKRLDACKSSEDAYECMERVDMLTSYKMTLDVLKVTRVGAAMNKFSQIPNLSESLKKTSAALVAKWRELAPKKTPAQIVAETTKAMTSTPSVPLNTEYKGDLTGLDARDKVRRLLFEGLAKGLAEEDRHLSARSFLSKIIADVETACFDLLVPKGTSNLQDYYTQVRALKFNLADPKNPDFIRNVINSDLEPAELAKMTSKDMASVAAKEEARRNTQEQIDAQRSDFRQQQLKKQDIAGQFSCRKCKSTRTTHFELQTRSSDEPMTVKVECIDCGFRFSF